MGITECKADIDQQSLGLHQAASDGMKGIGASMGKRKLN